MWTSLFNRVRFWMHRWHTPWNWTMLTCILNIWHWFRMRLSLWSDIKGQMERSQVLGPIRWVHLLRSKSKTLTITILSSSCRSRILITRMQYWATISTSRWTIFNREAVHHSLLFILLWDAMLSIKPLQIWWLMQSSMTLTQRWISWWLKRSLIRLTLIKMWLRSLTVARIFRSLQKLLSWLSLLQQ